MSELTGYSLMTLLQEVVDNETNVQRIILANEAWANEIAPALGEYDRLVSSGCLEPEGAARIMRVILETVWYKGYQAGKRSAGIKPLVFKEVTE